jgi:Flp pilus assembly protein TadD
MSTNRSVSLRAQFGWVIVAITVLMPVMVRSQSLTAEALVAQGDVLFKAQNFTDAVESYEKAIALKPSADAYIHLGQAYRGLKNYSEAVAAFRQAVQLKPNDSSSDLYLANAYFDLHKYAEAVSAAKQAVRLKPDYAEAFNTLGITYFRLEDFPNAEAAFREAVRLDPKHPVYLRNLTKTLIDQRKTSEANASVEQLRKMDAGLATEMANDIYLFIETSRDDASGLLEDGFEAIDNNDYATSLRLFRHALLIKPRRDELPLAHYGKASAHYWLDDNAKALFHIREAIRLDPKDARYPALLGHIYVDMGNKIAAQQTYIKLVAMDKKLAAELLEAIKQIK